MMVRLTKKVEVVLIAKKIVSIIPMKRTRKGKLALISRRTITAMTSVSVQLLEIIISGLGAVRGLMHIRGYS